MNKELLFNKQEGMDKNGACAYYLPEYECIHVEWYGYPTTKEFKEILNLVLEAVEKFDCKNWLADMLKLSVISEEADTWVKEEYIPQMAKTKLRKIAVLLPQGAMARFSISEMTDAIKAEKEKGNVNFETRYFTDIETALRWFKEPV